MGEVGADGVDVPVVAKAAVGASTRNPAVNPTAVGCLQFISTPLIEYLWIISHYRLSSP